MPGATRFAARAGEKIERHDYDYRVKPIETQTGRCPRCNGKIGRDPIEFCLNCSWEGETRDGEPTPEAVMAGGRGGEVGRFEHIWQAENTPRKAFKRTRLSKTLEMAARVYEMRELGIDTNVIQKVTGLKRERVSDMYWIHKREVLGES